MDIESTIGWICSFFVFAILFNVLNKRRKGKNISTWLKTVVIGLCIHINVILSLLLYEPIMELFDINTHGFMNLSGVNTLAVIWLVIALIALILAKALKELLGGYYNTVRTSQIVFLCLPFLIILLFLFIVGLK